MASVGMLRGSASSALDPSAARGAGSCLHALNRGHNSLLPVHRNGGGLPGPLPLAGTGLLDAFARLCNPALLCVTMSFSMVCINLLGSPEPVSPRQMVPPLLAGGMVHRGLCWALHSFGSATRAPRFLPCVQLHDDCVPDRQALSGVPFTSVETSKSATCMHACTRIASYG